MAKHKILLGRNVHVWLGSSGILSIHTKELINLGDKLVFGNVQKEVTKLRSIEQSKFYTNHRFYELNFK